MIRLYLQVVGSSAVTPFVRNRLCFSESQGASGEGHSSLPGLTGSPATQEESEHDIQAEPGWAHCDVKSDCSFCEALCSASEPVSRRA